MPIKKVVVGAALALGLVTNAFAQIKPRIQARLIWQDAAEQKLFWGDLKKGDAWSFNIAEIAKHPNLDADRHMFVQMQKVAGVGIVGVRDDSEGNFKSGWFAFDSGVKQEAHGDHFHWHYIASPKVIASKLDKGQGNPAHVYLYDDSVFIANDKKNGFTVVKLSQLGKAVTRPDKFFQAGGGHITLAAIGGKVAYSTWIDRDGDNKGRVDVVGLGSNKGRGYHFHLPSGGIHGATTNSGKIFFAPSDGVCWVNADLTISSNENSVDVHHISLGENEDGTPRRTGAFTNLENSVIFTVGGRSDSPELCIVDATSAKPSVTKIDMQIEAGHSLSTPTLLQSRTGKKFALLFEENPGKGDGEMLHVVSLDPNRDGNFDDAMLNTSISIGPSLIEGHSGHHSAVALSTRFVAVSNPGNGTISVISTSNWEIESTLNVGGNPTRLVAFGGQ